MNNSKRLIRMPTRFPDHNEFVWGPVEYTHAWVLFDQGMWHPLAPFELLDINLWLN